MSTIDAKGRVNPMAYAALGLLTLIWGSNWIVMKFALLAANPVTLNVQRTWVAVVILFAALLGQPENAKKWAEVLAQAGRKKQPVRLLIDATTEAVRNY